MPKPERERDGGTSSTCGIGVAFKPDPKGRSLVVKRIISGGPADLSGMLHIGDVLHSVDNVLCQGSTSFPCTCTSVWSLGADSSKNVDRHAKIQRGVAAARQGGFNGEAAADATRWQQRLRNGGCGIRKEIF